MRINAVVKMALLAMPLLLSGCATFHQAHQSIHLASDTAQNNIARMQKTAPLPVVQTVSTPYLMGDMVRVDHSDTLPAIFRKTVNLSVAKPLTIGQFATQISMMSGVPVHVAAQVQSFLSGGAAGSSLPPLPGGKGAAPILLPNVSNSRDALTLSWNGSLKGLFDLVATRTGTYWEYRHGVVRFFLTRTEAFEVDALPGTTGMNATISNSGSNGGGGGGGAVGGNSGATAQSATMSTSMDIYKSLLDGVNTVLAQTKAATSGTNAMGSINIPTSVSANQSTGQIIVTATPPELRAVAAYLRTVNAEMRKNVMIEVHVYSVTLDNAQNYGLNLNAAFQALGKQYGVNLTGATPPAVLSSNGETAGSLGLSILNTATGALGQWGGSQIVAQALATQGNVALVDTSNLLTMNGQPVPLQVAKQVSYLASTATSNVAQVGSSTALTPGQFTVGFSGIFLPLVRGHDIQLEYTINLSQSAGLSSYSSNGSSIQLPQINYQASQQRVTVRSGQTLILTGFSQNTSQVQHSGTGAANVWELGGGASAEKNRQELVVVIRVLSAGV